MGHFSGRRMLRSITAILLAAVMLMGPSLQSYALGAHKTAKEKEPEVTAVSSGEFRAVWFSFRDWQAYLQGKSEADFRSTFESVCNNTVANGMNTIIVHVRSHNDAVYPSVIYPWSTEMLGGVSPGFDPLAIIVETAHRYGLKIHAWVNPYGYRNGEFCGDANLATHDNILAGIGEILEHYQVDGIHFDDYFPPLGAATHNTLLRDVYSLTHAYGKVFGVSPQGNIDNNINGGADVVTWLSNTGYVDYLCPQLYWTDNYGSAGNVTMFSDRLAAWKALDTAGIPMYVGLAAYKAGESISGDPGWAMNTTNLASQVQKLRASGCGGFILYSYSGTICNAASAEMQNLKSIL